MFVGVDVSGIWGSIVKNGIFEQSLIIDDYLDDTDETI